MSGEHLSRLRLAFREARTVRVSLIVAAGMNLLAWILFLWFVIPRLASAPFFSLHYTVYFGVDRIGAPWRLVSMPAIGFGILLLNAFLISRLHVRDRLASTLVAVATVFFEALLLWAGFLNVLLNV